MAGLLTALWASPEGKEGKKKKKKNLAADSRSQEMQQLRPF
jgi:hypothetical protein